MIWDPHYTLYVLIPTLVIGLAAQFYVKAAFARASRIRLYRGLTGAEAAREVLAGEGIEARTGPGGPDAGPGVVRIEPASGFLSDHYDPSSRTLRLSPDVYGKPSLAAVAVAAHEAGHAIQHRAGYLPLVLRTGVVPLVTVGQFLAQIALMVGLFMAGGLRGPVFQIAVLGYGLMVLFALVTLPVEFNASRRALASLASNGIVTEEELPVARGVLRAAALTYVAAAVTAILHLLYVLSLRRDD